MPFWLSAEHSKYLKALIFLAVEDAIEEVTQTQPFTLFILEMAFW